MEREKSGGWPRIEDAECSNKGDFSLLGICQRQVNGVLKFAGTVKIRGFDTFSRCKLRDGGCRVSYDSTLKLSGGRRLYGVYIYHVRGYRVSH